MSGKLKQPTGNLGGKKPLMPFKENILRQDLLEIIKTSFSSHQEEFANKIIESLGDFKPAEFESQADAAKYIQEHIASHWSSIVKDFDSKEFPLSRIDMSRVIQCLHNPKLTHNEQPDQLNKAFDVFNSIGRCYNQALNMAPEHVTYWTSTSQWVEKILHREPNQPDKPVDVVMSKPVYGIRKVQQPDGSWETQQVIVEPGVMGQALQQGKPGKEWVEKIERMEHTLNSISSGYPRGITSTKISNVRNTQEIENILHGLFMHQTSATTMEGNTGGIPQEKIDELLKTGVCTVGTIKLDFKGQYKMSALERAKAINERANTVLSGNTKI